MTTLTEGRSLATDLFVTNWNDRTPYVLGNDKTDLYNGTAAWVRMIVRHAVGGQETLGGVGQRRFKRNAVAQVTVYSPTNAGKATADGHVQTALGILEAKRYEGLHFMNAQVRELGQDGKWDVTVVEADFFYEERK